MADCGFIDDGYTRKSSIKGIPGLYPEVTFSWRPTGIVARARYLDYCQKAGSQAGTEQRAGECLARQLVSWDLVDRHGNPRDISADAVMALNPRLFNRLYAIVVMMYEAPDEEISDGQWQEAELAATAEGKDLESYLEKN